MSKAPECVDCIAQGSPTWRPIKSGTRKPRCATHTHAAAKQARLAAHARMVQKTYGLPEGAYWALYEAQGGKCAICQVATGKTKRLAVDHDHAAAKLHNHPNDQGCVLCVRGLLCGPCNQLIGKYPAEALVRALNYKLDPPAGKVISGGWNDLITALASTAECNCPPSTAAGLALTCPVHDA